MFIGRKRRRVRFNDFSLRCSNFSSSLSTSDAQLLVLELRRSDNTTISDEQMMLTEMLSYWRTAGLVCRRTECDRFDMSTAKSTSWFDWCMSITQFGEGEFRNEQPDCDAAVDDTVSALHRPFHHHHRRLHSNSFRPFCALAWRPYRARWRVDSSSVSSESMSVLWCPVMVWLIDYFVVESSLVRTLFRYSRYRVCWTMSNHLI